MCVGSTCVCVCTMYVSIERCDFGDLMFDFDFICTLPVSVVVADVVVAVVVGAWLFFFADDFDGDG